MISEKCPDCGAGVAPNTSVCSYCGSTLVLSNVARKWTAITNHLPPPSPDNPNHSIMVLICFAKNGGNFVDDEDGTVGNFYAGSVIAAYYDFKNQKWHNDLFGKWAEPMPVTHWMPLPPSDSADWIPLVLRAPELEGTNEGESVDLLICDKSLSYEGSIVNGHMNLNHKKWQSGAVFNYSLDSDNCHLVTASHWMPLPDIPPF
jgi:hypothetical protein